MASALAEIHVANWSYVIMTIAGKIKMCLRNDESVHEAIRGYLGPLSEQQLSFYHLYRIDSDYTLHSAPEGRRILRMYSVIREASHQGLRNAGLTAEVDFFESLAYLADKRSLQAKLQGLENLLVHNQDRGFFKRLGEYCEKYQLENEAAVVNKLSEQLALYKKHAEARRQAIKAAKASHFKSWFMRLKETFF